MAEITSIYGNKFVDEKARQDITESEEQIQQNTNDISDLNDDFHAYHSELGAGYADQIVSSIESEDKTPYNFRKVPYDATLEKVEGIVGCDVVVNQLVEDGFSITGNASKALQNGASVVSNHIYFYGLKRDVNTENVQSDLYTRVNGNATPIFSIFMQTGGSLLASTIVKSNYSGVSDGTQGNGSLWFYVGSTTTVTTTSEYMLFDLTQTFGSQIADYAYSLEQYTAGSGVAWLKANFPKIFDAEYIAYNAGTMVHVSGLSAKKTVGFNQWDQVAEAGTYSNTGAPMSSSSEIRSKNYIKIISGQTYYFKSPNTLYVTKYDSNYVCLGETGVINGTRTFDDNVKYIRFCTGGSYGGTYKNDICINLSDPAKNGTYEPYTEHTYPLDSTIDLHGILKLDANNQLYADGDVYMPDGTVSHRYGVVDLGTLNWNSSDTYLYKAIIPGCKKVVSPPYENRQTGAIITKYVADTHYSISVSSMADKTWLRADYDIYIKDTSYADATSFKTAMSGVYMLYELATPTTETAEPYNPNQICDPNGTEEYISTTVAPVGHVTKYPLDIAGRLDNILTMPTSDGTYTLRAVVSNGNVTYSWVSA